MATYTADPGENVISALDDDFHNRIDELLDIGGALLAPDRRPQPPVASDAGAAALAVRELLAAAVASLAADELADATAWEVLEDLHDASLKLLRERFVQRFAALERVQTGIAQLRQITAPAAMLERAPIELCANSAFKRVVLSRIEGRQLVAESMHVRSDPNRAQQLLGQLQVTPLQLEHAMVETEVMRRRRASIVLDAQLHPRVHRATAEIMGWTSYAAAPLILRDRVVGLLHADHDVPGRQVDALDRDVLWTFAFGLAQTWERAMLRRALRREREQLRTFVEWLKTRSDQLSDAAIELLASPDAAPVFGTAGTAGSADRAPVAMLETLLTRRELDVIRLMAEGQNNSAIAAALVLAPSTIKFHVHNILGKMHAHNRAEAVSRYLRLTGGQLEDR